MVLGRLLGLSAILLQIAVFLQPLLPEKFQISPVCETVAQALHFDHPSGSLSTPSTHLTSHSDLIEHDSMASMSQHHAHSQVQHDVKTHQHDINHQCQYCVVYSHVLPLPDVDLKQILLRVQVRFLAFLKNFVHVFFRLHQLFLIPQGRAPPVSFSI